MSEESQAIEGTFQSRTPLLSDDARVPKEVVYAVAKALEKTQRLGLYHQAMAVLDALRGLPPSTVTDALSTTHEHLWEPCQICTGADRCWLCGQHRQV